MHPTNETSPIDFCHWLKRTEPHRWPTTLDALSKAGVGHNIIEWLFLEINADRHEVQLVSAFLALFSEAKMAFILSEDTTPHAAGIMLRDWLQNLAVRVGVQDDPILSLQKHLLAQCRGITASKLPEPIK